MSDSKKNKLLFAPGAVVHKRFRELWEKANPEGKFDEVFSAEAIKWLNVWVSLRIKGEGLAEIAQAFGEKITRQNKRMQTLERKLHLLKQHISVLQAKKRKENAWIRDGESLTGSVGKKFTTIGNHIRQIFQKKNVPKSDGSV